MDELMIAVEDEGGPPGLRATVAALALAAEYAVDLAAIKGSGEGGLVLEADVERAIVARYEEA